MAGLRPYRRSGFVVHAEPLGEKRLVHNYGHGGGGITLSWGSSKLAAELGLQGHSGAVAVLGSGVMGLSMARLAQEAGFPVTIYTAALPPDTTSNIAGGQFHPFAVFHEGYEPAGFMTQFTRALDYSWRRFQIMVGEDYGIRWLPTYVETDSPESKLLESFPPIDRMLAPAEHPFPWKSALRYDTMYVETGRYLRQMLRDVQIAGGRIEVRKLASPADIAALPERLVFNCTGLGSRDLFGDADLHPARGQLAILEPQPEVQYALTGALRNGWRRQQPPPELREEVRPRNMLMIGPTGCGKTEISRRLAKLADAPFVKVEASKFTEVGYVGRDVEQIARDLVEEAVRLEKTRRREAVRENAEEAATARLLDALGG